MIKTARPGFHNPFARKGFEPKTYAEFCGAMRNRSRVTVVSPTTRRMATGLINGIKPEDGSGEKWIVTVCTDSNEYVDLYVLLPRDRAAA